MPNSSDKSEPEQPWKTWYNPQEIKPTELKPVFAKKGDNSGHGTTCLAPRKDVEFKEELNKDEDKKSEEL